MGVGFAESILPFLHLVMELGVMNRDGGLAGERRQKFDLVLLKIMLLLGIKREDSQRLFLRDQRNSQIRNQSLAAQKLLLPGPGILLNIPNEQGRLGFEDQLGQPAPDLPAFRFPIFFLDVPAGSEL